MKLRGHHLFCTALFSGHGYSKAFTDKMAELIASLESGEKMELLVGADALCKACPNQQEGGKCALGTEDVASRDENAMRVLSLRSGDVIGWEKAKKKLDQVTEKEFQAVCGNCRWQREGLCSFALLRERARPRN